MESKTYIIPEANLSTLTFALTRLQKKAVKLGMQLHWSHEHHHNNTDLEGKVTRYHQLTLSGETPKFEGWTFIATLQLMDNASIVRAVPGKEVPIQYREATNNCDHCQMNRRRVDTFLVQHDNGTYKQVGRSCLADFLGHENPHNLAAYAEVLATAGALAGDSEGEEKEPGHGPSCYSLAYLLPVVAACVRTRGWTSRTTARDDYTKRATADDAFDQLYDTILKPEQRISINEKDHSDAEAALAWAEELSNKSNKSDYEHNVSLVAVSGVYDRRTLGIAASILSSWQRNVVQENERKFQIEKSQWVGTVGEKVEFDGTLISARTHENSYGVQYGYTFSDSVGNVFTWWTNSLNLVTGSVYKIKGTIKKHDSFRDVKQTNLTRCKITAKEAGTVSATCRKCDGTGVAVSRYHRGPCPYCDGGKLKHKEQ